MLLNDQLINTYPLEKIRILLDDKLRFWNVYDVLRIPETKLTTFRKAKLKKWDRQTNIDKFGLSALTTVQNIIFEHTKLPKTQRMCFC